MNRGYAIFLCDVTGNMAEPWERFGYTTLLVDPQHTDYGDGFRCKFPGTVEDAMPLIGDLIRSRQVKFVMGFPPCTDVALSGTRWWADKMKEDFYFQARASIVAEQCRTIGELSGAPWAFENPKSAFSKIFGEPQHKFHPWYYSGYCEDDQYFKETWLWSGGGFIMPPYRHTGIYGEPDNRIHMMPGTEDQANLRSETPRGFARAVFLANAPELREQKLS